MKNIYSNLPTSFKEEFFEELIQSEHVRVERIVSKGHVSPESGWYDQDEHEWVIILEGSGILQFEDHTEATLSKGDYLNIPAHTKHKVTWTDSDTPTIWLAVFYK